MGMSLKITETFETVSALIEEHRSSPLAGTPTAVAAPASSSSSGKGKGAAKSGPSSEAGRIAQYAEVMGPLRFASVDLLDLSVAGQLSYHFQRDAVGTTGELSGGAGERAGERKDEEKC
jgi:hypothetical protein